jgi:hypothetical protein
MKSPEGYPGQNQRAYFRPNVRQNSEPMKRQGFVGLYHPFNGKVYSGTKTHDDEDLFQAYLFGENAILSSKSYGNYKFIENLERHCLEFDVNRVHGILLPPSENGVVNSPKDNNLLEPAASPGMIQSAHRFSELSQILPQINGMIIDDFWANYGRSISYDDLKDIKGALLGKSVDAEGMVDHDSPSKTSHLKLYVVTYEREIGRLDKNALNLIDGISLWIYNQNSNYNNLDKYINDLNTEYPEKDLLIGIYIHNSDYGDMSRNSISFMLQKSYDFYEAGLVSGVHLFAGHWLVKDHISEERSRQISLSDMLYSDFYPYLGEVRCQLLDECTKMPLDKVCVRIGQVNDSEKITWAARKSTNALGTFRFSGWSGRHKRSVYTFTAEKEGYEPICSSFVILPNQSIDLPVLCLRPLSDDNKMSSGRGTDEEPASLIALRTHSNGHGGMVGDRLFPCCVVFSHASKHNWGYSESQVLDVLYEISLSSDQLFMGNGEDLALKCLMTLREKLKGCPCGMAWGEDILSGLNRPTLVYWTDPLTWRFWDPINRSSVNFCCKYIIA